MTKTLLEMVQSVLTEISGDEVDSISDTAEAEEVAYHIKSVYENLVSHTKWSHTRRAAPLISFSDNDFPTHMKLKPEIKELISVYYDKRKLGETRKQYKEVVYLDLDDFLRKLNLRDNSDTTNVKTVIDPSGIELFILKNKAPEFYTSIDDVNIIFDSYDSAIDNILAENKFQATAYIIPPFEITDDFIPDLPPDAFSYLIQESVSRCQFKMRQVQDVKSEQEALKQSRWLSRNAWRTKGGIKYPNYGRKR